MEVWGFLPKNSTQKPASHFLYNNLFLKFPIELNFLLTNYLMSLAKRNSTMDVATGLISSLFDVA